MARKRGNLDSSDIKMLEQQNKALKRKLRSALKEIGRCQKRTDGASGEDAEEEAPAVLEPEPIAADTCPACGGSKVTVMDLEIRSGRRKFICCQNPDCRKRSRVK
jgi:hypothetical protein